MKLPLKLKITLGSVLLIVFFIVLNLTATDKEIKNFFYIISSPIEKSFWKAGDGISDFLLFFLKLKILQEENEDIYLKNQELVSEIILLKELKKENQDLRDVLNIGLEKEFQLNFARVIGRDVFQDSILIDNGSKDNISKGLPVITKEKVLLGRIGEVYENFSEVILISNKKSFFDAKISEKEIYGLVRGKGNSALYLDLVSKDKEISEGNFVVTSALGGNFPQGLLVGSIKKVKKSDIEPFQTAEIEPGFDLKKIESLFIITNFR